MRQKIFSSGRRPAILLPRSFLRELGLREGSPVELRLDDENGCIQVAPVAEPVARAEARVFVKQVDRLIERYRRTLERLAR